MMVIGNHAIEAGVIHASAPGYRFELLSVRQWFDICFFVETRKVDGHKNNLNYGPIYNDQHNDGNNL